MAWLRGESLFDFVILACLCTSSMSKVKDPLPCMKCWLRDGSSIILFFLNGTPWILVSLSRQPPLISRKILGIYFRLYQFRRHNQILKKKINSWEFLITWPQGSRQVSQTLGHLRPWNQQVIGELPAYCGSSKAHKRTNQWWTPAKEQVKGELPLKNKSTVNSWPTVGHLVPKKE